VHITSHGISFAYDRSRIRLEESQSLHFSGQFPKLKRSFQTAPSLYTTLFPPLQESAHGLQLSLDYSNMLLAPWSKPDLKRFWSGD
jgi:hypothetical protein